MTISDIKFNLPNDDDLDPDAQLTLGALSGNMLILDQEGNLHNIEDLACNYHAQINVLSLDRFGRLRVTKAYSFRIGEWSSSIIRIVLDNQQVLETTPKQKLLTSGGDWIAAEDIDFGSILTTAIYDPTMPYPSKTVAEVIHMREDKQLFRTPSYTFSVSKSLDNLLVANETPQGTITLVPAQVGLPIKN